jgi:hypothetical protein
VTNLLSTINHPDIVITADRGFYEESKKTLIHLHVIHIVNKMPLSMARYHLLINNHKMIGGYTTLLSKTMGIKLPILSL